ncbi:MAG: hypothetical protein QM733_00105 [Ilumatobacteraceae bacterium]
MDDLVVERTVELDVDHEQLWALIATPEGWRDWLVDEAQLVDGAGIVVDGGVARHVRVDDVVEGRSVGFTWWEDDDPASISHVRLTIGDDGALHVAERLLAEPRTAEAKLAWEVRVCSLWACTVAAALV